VIWRAVSDRRFLEIPVDGWGHRESGDHSPRSKGLRDPRERSVVVEGLLFIAALIALGWLAPRYGVDSREGIESAEHALARHGVRWEV
jgi:hypothetical protein